MELIDSLESASEQDKALMRLAAQRYLRAVRLRAAATEGDDPLALAGATGEFRDAVRSLLNLGFPLEAIPTLYEQAMSDLRSSDADG